MPDAESIIRHIENALGKLDIALAEVIELSQNSSEDLYHVGKLGRAIGLLREFQKPIYEKRPDLKPPPPWEGLPEPSLTTQEADRISTFTDEKVQAIDRSLLSLATHHFQKVAKIVAEFMSQSELHERGVPDLYYAQRIEDLAARGELEFQGNLKFMRYCEIRVPKT